MPSLIWFRRDLRIQDNKALHHAAKASTDGVIGIYFLTPKQWQEHDDAACKVKFWLNNLAELSDALGKLNIPLRIESCESFDETPSRLIAFAKKHKCDSIFLNREYEVNESRRDQQLISEGQKADIGVQLFHDRIIIPPSEIKTKEGKFYSVFTPFRRVWDTKAMDFIDVLPKPKKQPELNIKSSRIPKQVDGFDFSDAREDLWVAGEKEGHRRLKEFSKKISNYNDHRDFPSINGTSLLSPYLAAGVISPRQCLVKAVAANKGTIFTPKDKSPANQGAATWISELTWRDFYTYVMVACPRVSMHQPFKLKTNQLKWRRDKNDLEAWKTGQTGYPIVDAGMRQLNRTGWMHNRLRMVTAMFLTKNLLIDWRLGEKYFMQKLIDGDLAANNGGWQWSASTGTDAVPYFRIFNPFSQSKRFDPEGKFIFKMCPELSNIPKTALHDSKKLAAAIAERNADFPSFVVDYKEGRERALSAFKSL